MEKYKVIPQGYMLVGEIAKKMGVPVSTLHYYDKKGVLSPASESKGGRRLYTHKDIVRLSQIQSMKHLGFSLEDIKTRLPLIDTPEEMSNILTDQAKEIREKINHLKDSLDAVEKLNAEVLQMETVDWEKCADIIALLQANSDSYLAVKHFDNSTLDHYRSRFDKESGSYVLNTYKKLTKKVKELQIKGLLPESEQGQALAKDWWDMIMDFTDGDMSLLPELSKLADKLSDNEENNKFEVNLDFIDKAMRIYFTNLGYNPFDKEEI
ncbi:MAG: MerR family transcriptional regulator [Defluviitaleaceae bacterium]|nr:MerR family transcriptional regulator [Defluviitaleaceae bacterium]